MVSNSEGFGTLAELLSKQDKALDVPIVSLEASQPWNQSSLLGPTAEGLGTSPDKTRRRRRRRRHRRLFTTATAKIGIPTGKDLIGSSEVPSLLGVSPFVSRYELWLRKTGRAPETTGTSSEAIDFGRALEPTIRILASQKLGMRFQRPRRAYIACEIRICAHPDGVTRHAVLEVKTSGLTGPIAQGWTEDDIPIWVAAQVQTQLALSGKREGFVAALLGGKGLVIYNVQPSPEFEEILYEEALKFWESVYKDTPPEPELDKLTSSTLIHNLRRRDEVTIVDDETIAHMLSQYHLIAANMRELEQQKEELKKKILLAIGDNRGIRAGDYEATVTRYSSSVFDTKRFKLEHPELASAYQVTRSYARLDVRSVATH